MIVPIEQFFETYKRIQQFAVGSACAVLILCAPDCDAMASCRIFTHLLRLDNIAYKVQPVANYTDVQQHGSLQSLPEDIRVVVLFNCGAVVPIAQLLGADQYMDRPPVEILVVDSHRPVHLANVHSQNVTVVDDGSLRARDVPSDGSDLDGASDSSDSSEEEEERDVFRDDEDDEDEEAEAREEEDSMDGEAELEDDAVQGTNNDEDEEDDDDGENEEDDENPNDAKTEEDVSDAEEAGATVNLESDADGEDDGEEGDADREKKEAAEGDDDDEEEEEAAEDALRRQKPAAVDGDDEEDEDEDNAVIVSRKRSVLAEEHDTRKRRKRRIREYYSLGTYFITPSAPLVYELSKQLNRSQNDLLWLAVVGMTEQYQHQRMDDEAYLSLAQMLTLDVMATNVDGQHQFQAEDGTLVNGGERGRIVTSDEYKFYLHRHWSLYESMMYSNYVCAKLAVWKSAGKQKLEEFLAKAGISLQQCNQSYTFMSPQLRRQFRDELQRTGPEYGLSDVIFPSFFRYNQFRTPIGASDIVYAINALCDPTRPDWIKDFNYAYDALSMKHDKALQDGIKASKQSQQAIVRQAVSMIENHVITRLKHFRYAYIHRQHSTGRDTAAADEQANGREDAQDLFASPAVLIRLAQFLVQVHVSMKRWTGGDARPLIIASELHNSYIVVGVTCPTDGGHHHAHRLGQLFRIAAADIKARIRHDGFDSAVLEIDRDDVQNFLESLLFAMGA